VKILKIILVGILLFAPISRADTAKNSVIKLVVPYAAGGSLDMVARAVGDTLSNEIGKTVVIEYRLGAGGTIGTSYVINSDPSETVLMVNNAPIVINTVIKDPPPYDENRLMPVAFIGRLPLVLVASKKSGVKDFKDWKKISQNKPILYGSSGIGSGTHISMAILGKKLNKNFVHVPYKGIPPFLVDLISGNLDAAFVPTVNALPYIESGKLIALAVDSNNRLPELPNIPTLNECGIDNVGDAFWYMLFSNQTNNTEEVEQVKQAMIRILSDPEKVKMFTETGLVIDKKKIIPSPTFIPREKIRFSKLAKELNLYEK
jgi:tripartite-type tricarboxylate transporter receptor subunit TctC